MRHTIHLLIVCVLTASSAIAQNEATLCRWLFVASSDFTSTAESAIELAAQATFAASSATGTLPTLTGTLTESSAGAWSYNTYPGTKLVIAFYGGGTVEYTFSHWEGFTGRGWEGFVDSHRMIFTVKVAGGLDLAIDSEALPVVGGGKTTLTRTISGTLLYDGVPTTVSLNHGGTKEWTVESGYAEFIRDEQCSGTTSSSSYTATISDQYFKHIIHDSNSGMHASNTIMQSNSSMIAGQVTYAYNNGRVKWAAWTPSLDSASLGIYNKVADPSYWAVSGTLTKNGAAYGTLQFSGPVIGNTSGPVLLLATSGGNYLIHPLLQFWVTGAETTPEGLPTVATLMQNYPNPFNPKTEIRFQVAATDHVKLSVFDLLGREVAVLVDEKKTPGTYEVPFDASGLASGVYVFRLSTGSFVQSRKMTLAK